MSKDAPLLMAWLGYLDNQPDVACDTRYEREWHYALFKSERAARRVYSDVRRVEIRLAPKGER